MLTRVSIRKVLWVLATVSLALFLIRCDGEDGGDRSPTVAFSAQPIWGQAALPVTFTNKSSVGPFQSVQVLWNFGDGSTSSEPNPIHVYLNPGSYTVTLTVRMNYRAYTATMTDYIKVSPNDVVAWNNIALQAMAAENWMPPQGSRGLAILHSAIYDAVNCVEKAGAAYLANLDPDEGAAKEAASAQAAYQILVQLMPGRKALFDSQLAASLAFIPEGEAKNSGIALGDSVAAIIWASRLNDGSGMMMGPPYMGGTAPGEWRPTPPGYMSGMFVHWRNVIPFALASASQFRPGPPPDLGSEAYALAFNEVKEIGSAASATRTMEQGMIANFWVGMPGSIMEMGRMNLVVQQAVAAHGLTLSQSARLFALVNIAMADAAIAGIDCKYFHSAWRTVTAIREAAGDGNSATTADPSWMPFITTPAHPEYISTHSALTSAASTVLINYFGSDEADLTLPSFMNPSITRHYNSFSYVAQEAGLSRIYGGIHFRFSYDEGTLLGQQVGAYVYGNVITLLE